MSSALRTFEKVSSSVSALVSSSGCSSGNGAVTNHPPSFFSRTYVIASSPSFAAGTLTRARERPSSASME